MDKLLEITTRFEESLNSLPNESLEDMLSSLKVKNEKKLILVIDKSCTYCNQFNFLKFKVILINVKQHDKDVDVLEASIDKNPSISDARETITRLKQRLSDLISRSENGITLIIVRFFQYNSNNYNNF